MIRPLICMLLGAFIAGTAPAQVYDKVVSFSEVLADTAVIRDNRGYHPKDFMEGPDGNFYGTTSDTIFKMTPDGVLTTLLDYNGASLPTGGSHPRLSVIGLDGFLYGTVPDGGTGGNGAIFKMPRQGGATSLVSLGTFTNQAGALPGKEPNFLMQGRDGWFYGLTRLGGAGNYGTIFKVSASGSYQLLKAFTGTGGGAAGENPVEMFQGRDGGFYGIAEKGGTGNNGVVFRITSTGDYSVLGQLTGSGGARPGSVPNELFQARDGSLYGTTRNGGPGGDGTVFRITNSGDWIPMGDFSTTGGSSPGTNLVQDSKGNLYGASDAGGGSNTFIFKINPAGGLQVIKEIHKGEYFDDDYGTISSLILGADDKLYGAVPGFSSSYGPMGFVFQLDPLGEYEDLHVFLGDIVANTGMGVGNLIQGRDGWIYGTNDEGGLGEAYLFPGSGNIFRVSTVASAEEPTEEPPEEPRTTPYEFESLVEFGRPVYPLIPFSPRAAVIPGSDGGLWGTSRHGSRDNLGTAFRITPAGTLTMVNGFNGNDLLFEDRDPELLDGVYPTGELVEGSDGFFFGITTDAEAFIDSIHSACVFKINAKGEPTRVVRSVGARDWDEDPLGVNPGLVVAADGSLYGNSPYGAFRVNQDGTGFQELAGGGGESSLVKGRSVSEPFFYGAYRNWIYKMQPDGTTTTYARVFDPNPTYVSNSSFQYVPIEAGSWYFTLSFDMTPHQKPMDGVVALSPQNSGGYNALACGVRVYTNGRIQAYNGDIDDYMADAVIEYNANQTYRVTMSVNLWEHRYSVAVNGTTLATNYAFRDTQMSATQLTQLAMIRVGSGTHSVTNIDDGKKDPQIVGALFEDIDGTLYGTTMDGGTMGYGKVFKVAPGGAVTILANFSNNGLSNKGRRPMAALVKHTDGFFYGTTSRGGAADLGTIFRMTSGGAIETLFEFDADARDSVPMSRLVKGPDNNLYGTTAGNDGGAGGVYRLIFDGPPSIYPVDGAALGFDRYRVTAKLNACGSGANAWIEYWIENPADPNAEPVAPDTVPLSAAFSGYRTVDAAATLTDLEQGVTYRYRIAAGNSNPLVSRSKVSTFQTSAAPTVQLVKVKNIDSTTTQFFAKVDAHNAETHVRFEYSTDGVNFGGSVDGSPASVDGNGLKDVTAAPDDLESGETYFVRVKAWNDVGSAEDGDIEFTTFTPPEVRITGATALSSTRVKLVGKVNAKGSDVDIHFEYRLKPDEVDTPWGDHNDPYRATPGNSSSNEEVEVTRELSGLTQGLTYEYRLVAAGDGGEDVSETGSFTLSLLSGLLTRYPDEPGSTDGALTILFDPPAVGAWRFYGEAGWRVSGEVADHLAGGSRLVEFLTIPGFTPLPAETVDVSGGESVVIQRSYSASGGSNGGGQLTVKMKPEALAGAQWKFTHETAWRSSATVTLPVTAGIYRIECNNGVAGRVAPAVTTVVVGVGQAVEATLTYESLFTALTPVAFGAVTGDEGLPYAYLGQIRSRAGVSTGFVVKRRVVATAAHVVFDDTTLSFIPELQWLHQRHADEHEPLPQVPRGYYLIPGYADQRRAEASPGDSSPQSRRLDGAALFFTQDAARGGYGGYLASEKGASNEYLGEDSAGVDKFLAGYAEDGVVQTNRGKLHVSGSFPGALEHVLGEAWATEAVVGTAGCSGGPLYVRHGTQGFFPAAIYLGGTGQSEFRAIDRDMVGLFLRAETSGNGGGNNTSGGITLSTVTNIGSASTPALISVLIEPPAARASARWVIHYPETLKLSPSIRQRNGDSLEVASAGAHILELTTVSGFDDPQPIKIEVTGGTRRTYTYTYGSSSALEAWRKKHFGTTENLGNGADSADPDGDGWNNLDEYGANTDPKNAADKLKMNSAVRAGNTFTVTTTAKAGRSYLLERSAGLSGDWSTVDSEGPFTESKPIELIDSSAPPSRAFYRIRVTVPP